MTGMRLVNALTLILMAGLLSGCLLSEKDKSEASVEEEAAEVIAVTPDEPDRKVALHWDAPVHRADNTGLRETEIKGYRVYYGRERGKYTEMDFIEKGQSLELMLSDRDLEGEYHFVVTAVDTNELESDYSETVSATF